MHTRRVLTSSAAAILLAVLLTAVSFQWGPALASPLAQATETGVATGTATDLATEATSAVTATVVLTGTSTAIPTTTATPVGPTPTPAGTRAPVPDGAAQRTITVTGLGEANAQPDEAFVQIGVQTDADTAAEALDQNNQQMEALIDALLAAGVQQGDITTQFVTLYPRYGDGTGAAGTGIVGYTAVNNIEVRVRDLDQLGDLLDTAVAAGGNTISGIRFSVSAADELSNAARADAMADARSKAEQLASLAGGTLGPVMSIKEGFQNGPVFQGGAELGAADVPIVPGSQLLQVRLEVTSLLQ
jgi:uncharacterized protein